MRRLLLALLLVLIGVQRSGAAPVFPRTVRDARGTAVTLRSAPHRIVSLAPGVTEMLFALGLGRSVVGDTVYCNYPAAALKIAKIGDVNTNVEKVLALRPDLIVASDANKRAVTRLGQLGQPVFEIAPTSFAATEQSLRLLGELTGADTQAQTVIKGMEAKRRAATAIASRDAGRRPRVLVVVGFDPLWTAGRGSFIDDIIARAGGVNVAASVPQYAPFSKEVLMTHPPDVIMAGPKDAAALRADPVLSALPAVRNGHFFHISDDEISRPGPRLADALLQVARALHPVVK